MSKKDFNVRDLFADPSKTEQSSSSSAPGKIAETSAPNKKKIGRKPLGVSRTLRSFNIEDALWDDFLVYVSLCGGTQVTVLNNMIREKIQQNADKIAQYKALFGDKQ